MLEQLYMASSLSLQSPLAPDNIPCFRVLFPGLSVPDVKLAHKQSVKLTALTGVCQWSVTLEFVSVGGQRHIGDVI